MGCDGLRWIDDAAQLGELAALSPPGDVAIHAAGVAFVNSIGMRARIASCQAGYACPACGREAPLLVDAIAHAGALRAPPLPCPECGAAMELADFPERYLSVFGA